MYILGISGPLWHDPSACLIRDDEIVAAAEEERFVRVKHAEGYAPVNAVKFCLNQAKIDLSDVDFIVEGCDPNRFVPREFIHQIRATRGLGNVLWRIGLALYSTYRRRKGLPSDIRRFFSEAGFSHVPQIEFIEHHEAHAASAFFPSSFSRASVLVIDGRGEYNCTSSWHGEHKLSKLNEMRIPNSLGLFYATVTKYLGFRINDEEWKVMGLSSYGKQNPEIEKVFSKIININDEGYALNLSFSQYGKHTHDYFISDDFLKLLPPPLKSRSHIDQIYKDIAYHAQRAVERAALSVVEKLIMETEIRDLCLAGGVGLNCVMNQRLLQSEHVDNIFIQPAANDAGVALGAALALHSRLGKKIDLRMDHVYFGPSFSNQEIERTLKVAKIPYEYHSDIAGVCAELLSKGKIIGWFQGRMELGPRALGNRSILADPRDVKMKDKVNHYVKGREPWRPFAPSILDHAKEEYLENAYPSPFMIITFKVKESKVKEIPAVVHVDGTTRPQTVERRINPKYWRLIKSFEDETGVPVVLNTSFNVRGEPIVCTPKEAIRDFFSTGMDCLALGNYLLMKSG